MPVMKCTKDGEQITDTSLLDKMQKHKAIFMQSR